jgi:hypothetical protein
MKKEKKKSPITRTDTDYTQTDADFTRTNTSSPRESASSPRESASSPPESASVEWQAPEFEYYRKDVSWYWLSLIVGIILLALSIWQKNFLFAVFVIIAWLVIVYSARRFPTIWNFKISEKGIEISLPNKDLGSAKFYPYSEIEGFDIHPASDECKELVLKVKSRFSPYLKINILANDEEKIKNFLLKYISKEEYSGSLADSFSKLIRF